MWGRQAGYKPESSVSKLTKLFPAASQSTELCSELAFSFSNARALSSLRRVIIFKLLLLTKKARNEN